MNKNCDPFSLVKQYKTCYRNYSKNFFPKILRFNYLKTIVFKTKLNGGWGDTRDHELCKSFINTSLNYDDL
jgi:hypothetical protein